MTYEKFIESYGDWKVKLKSCYKYSLTFVPIEDTGIESVSVSGSDNIYRFEIDVDKTYTIKELEPSVVHFKNGTYINFDY